MGKDVAKITLGRVYQDLETTRVRKDGTQVAISMTVSPVPDDQGHIIGVSLIAHDITALKQAEGALKGSRDELVASNASLEQANLARSQFLATMSHELRTPLASIMGFGEMLLEDAQAAGWSQQQQSNLESILTNSEHLLDLINDVLDLSKIEAGRMTLDYSQVDPRALLCEVAAEIGSLAIKRNLFLKTEVQDGLDSLETNPGKLHQILLNLLSNALKFTEHGGVTLSASRVLLSDQETVGMAFVVQDSGIGIPAELHEHIFEAFYQTDMSYTRKVAGTGLGLAIVSQLTALLGGTITVASAPDQGSTFTVTLPLKPAHRFAEQDLPRLHPGGQPQNVLTTPPAARELVPVPSHDVPEGAGQQEVAAGDRDLILAVDDNAESIVVIKEAMRDTPYTVVGVQYPLTVMGLVQELHPCAITLDVMMPQLNGWQLLHQLKDNPATASIPIVILTVLSEQTTGYVLGADDYVVKPYKKEMLRNRRQEETEESTLVYSASREKERNSMNDKTTDEQHTCILIVDDNEEMCRMLTQLLERAGYRLVLAADGQASLTQAKQHHPELILMDLSLPDMDGWEAVRHLRKMQEFRDTPIIAVTAHVSPAEQAHALAAGCTVHLGKPFRTRSLLKTIEQLLKDGENRHAS